jgi:hypothetical protein
MPLTPSDSHPGDRDHTHMKSRG